jgi:hypothetical protein
MDGSGLTYFVVLFLYFLERPEALNLDCRPRDYELNCVPPEPGFDPGSVHMGFVMDKVALGQVFPRILRFSLVSFIPPVLNYLENRGKNKLSLHLHHTVAQ